MEWVGRRGLAVGYLLMGLLGAAAYLRLPRGGPGQGLLFVALNGSAAVAILVGVRLYRPARALAWYAVAAAEGFLVLGNILWFTHRIALGVELPFPSVADAFYLAAFPFFAAGLALLTRDPRRDRGRLIDGLIILLGSATLSWLFLMAPQLDDGLPLPAQVIALTYPLMDLILFSLAAKVLITRPGGTPAYRLLLLGFLVAVAGGTAYVRSLMNGTYYIGNPVDAGWLLSYTFVGTAALHPSMASLFQSTRPRSPRSRLLILAAAVLVAPLAMLVQGARDKPVDLPVLAGLSAGLSVLVLIRVAQLSTDVAERRRAAELLEREATFVRLLQLAAREANQATTVDSALSAVMAGACKLLGWPLGRAMVVTGEEGNVAVAGDLWHVEDEERFAELQVTGRGALDALAARILATGRPAWLDGGFDPEASDGTDPAGQGIAFGFGLPVQLRGETVAALQFVSDRPLARDGGLLAVAADMGVQLGRVVERDQLQRAERERRVLADRLIDERERERAFIASGLHEGVLQQLAAVQIQADNVISSVGTDHLSRVAALAGAVREGVASSIADLRAAIADLRRPGLEDENLATTLERYARSFQAETGIAVVLHVEPPGWREIPLPLGLLLFQCCREALTNMARRAHASRVEVWLIMRGGLVELRVKDNGQGVVGWSDDRLRLGLSLTRDKVVQAGGGVWLETGDEAGSELTVRVPIRAVP